VSRRDEDHIRFTRGLINATKFSLVIYLALAIAAWLIFG
jgi:hypothetical protein